MLEPIRILLAACFAALAFCCHAAIAAQTYPQTETSDARADFVDLFDGHSLDGWEGDPIYWRVEDGIIVGEVTPETLLRRNSFLIWRGGAPADFELKVVYRISEHGNSGVNYRSVEVPDPANTMFALRGYQADVDGFNPAQPEVRHTANNYEERGRTFMALRGQITRADPGGTRTVIGTIGDYVEMTGMIKEGDWNEMHIIARGSTVIHLLNGHLMSVVIDNDPENRRADGLIGVQVHVGPPMKIEYRTIRLKQM